MNRTAVTIILILAIIGLGALVWWYFLPSLPSTPGQKTRTGELPDIGGRGKTGTPTTGPNAQQSTTSPAVSNQPPPREIIAKDILAPAISADGKSLLYILRENGHVVTSGLDGSNESTVVNLTVLQAFDASWPLKRDRVFVSYFGDGVVKSFLEGVATGTVSRFLPSSVTSFDWSPDGKSVAYITKRSTDSALTIADSANKNPRVVYTTPIPDFNVRWLAKNTILLVSRPSGLAPSLVLAFNVTTRSTAPIMSGTHGIVIQPLPNGIGFVFSRSKESGEADTLALYTFASGVITPLNITTIADKCVVSADSKTLYCGVPNNGIRGIMPDDWYRGKTSFSDSLVAVDIATNQTVTLAAGSFDADIISPFISPDQKYIYFQNKKNESLWRVTLGQ